jgi:hypothetical protein
VPALAAAAGSAPPVEILVSVTLRIWRRPTAAAHQQRASIYRRDDVIFIVSQSRNVDGFYQEAPPYVELSINSEWQEIGHAILDALSRSRPDVPNPFRDPVYRRKRSTWGILDVAGVKSHRTFMQGARLAAIARELDKIRFTPTKNDGGGFEDMPDVDLLAHSAAPEEVGRQALAALDLS